MNSRMNDGALQSSGKKVDVKKIATLAMFVAIAYAVMVVGRVPIIMWFKYDPKDIIIAISGFIYGPLSALAVSVIVSLIEMFTVSEQGIWGFVMNVISTCALVCPAALIYKKSRTQKGALIGLVSGFFIMLVVMLLWNYLIIPLYTSTIARADVAGLLLSVILPFNVLKGGLNVTLTVLLYKPVVKALRRARLLPANAEAPQGGTKSRKGIVTAVACVALVSLVLLGLALAGVI